MTALQDTPLRIPDAWSAAWFRRFVVEVLAKADARNVVGQGITVTSDGNSVATFSTQTGVEAAIATHDGNPFAHGNLMAGHAADRDAHRLVCLRAELLGYFLGA